MKVAKNFGEKRSVQGKVNPSCTPPPGPVDRTLNIHFKFSCLVLFFFKTRIIDRSMNNNIMIAAVTNNPTVLPATIPKLPIEITRVDNH